MAECTSLLAERFITRGLWQTTCCIRHVQLRHWRSFVRIMLIETKLWEKNDHWFSDQWQRVLYDVKGNFISSLNPFALWTAMFRIWAVAIRSKQCRYFRSGFSEFCVFPIDDLQVIWMFEEKMITGFLDKCDKIYMEWKPRKCSFIICLPFLSAIFWWGDMDRFSIKTPQNLTCLPCYSLCVKLRTGKCTLLFIMIYYCLGLICIRQ